MIVDINGFTRMVAADETGIIAQDVSDSLVGAIAAIEREGGEVVGFMGDAILGILETPSAVVNACWSIAKDVDRTREWISGEQASNTDIWTHMPGGPGLKITVEFGSIDVSPISSRYLGVHRLLIGSAINHASRIGAYGDGCRCLLGPEAAKVIGKHYRLDGPFTVQGKAGEGEYICFQFGMGDFWKEGKLDKDEETYWG